MPSNRVSDCRVAVAPRPPQTRNEDTPDPPPVRHDEGMEKQKWQRQIKLIAIQLARNTQRFALA